jgi:homoserine acetyltransferase
MVMNPQKIKHAHDRAAAKGWAAALTGNPNPYKPGSYCAISFDQAKIKATAWAKDILENIRQIDQK